jgi:pyruvate formate lyase activating enzyme
VYAGNLPGQVGDLESTFCPGCGRVLIERTGFYIKSNRLDDGCCPDCRVAIPGVWDRTIRHPLPEVVPGFTPGG